MSMGHSNCYDDPALRAPLSPGALARVSRRFEPTTYPIGKQRLRLPRTTDIPELAPFYRVGVEAPQQYCVRERARSPVEVLVHDPRSTFLAWVQKGSETLGISVFDAMNAYSVDIEQKGIIANALRGATIGAKVRATAD